MDMGWDLGSGYPLRYPQYCFMLQDTLGRFLMFLAHPLHPWKYHGSGWHGPVDDHFPNTKQVVFTPLSGLFRLKRRCSTTRDGAHLQRHIDS